MVTFKFKKVHFSFRVEAGLLEGRMEALTLKYSRRESLSGVVKASCWRDF